MKHTKLISTALVAATLISLCSTTVLAADPAPAESKGRVGFKAPGDLDNTITIPEVVPEVEITPPTEGGFSTADGMAILAPYLDFGTDHEITQKEEIFKALPMKYTENNASKKVHNLPPMTVVKDLRGSTTGGWNVNVKASNFVTASGEVLVADLMFTEAKLFNNAKIPTGQTLPNPADQNVSEDADFTFAGKVVVPAAPFIFTNTDQVLMSAKAGKGSGQTTYVPDATKYDGVKMSEAIKNGTDFYAANDEIAGVQLRIPAGSKRTTAEYTSTLTWTLSTTP